MLRYLELHKFTAHQFGTSRWALSFVAEARSKPTACGGNNIPRPDFFVVGAFKSGSTALYDQLRRHPQIFMPFHKEPLYFGDDLTRRYGRMSLDDYLRLFKGARPGQRIGEASTWYLYSTSAAHEIKGFAPGARIMVVLRNPVDVMYAQHNQLIFNVIEDIPDFADALAAEPDRRAGKRLPPGPINVENLFYRHSVHFAEQLERYFDVFGRDRVHVMLTDDMRRDGTGVVRGALEFLGVDPSLAAAPPKSNENRRVRSPWLQRLIFAPKLLLPLAPFLRRFPLVRSMRTRMLEMNSEAKPRPPMDPVLRRQLIEEFTPEIERLGKLIDRDLSAWLELPPDKSPARTCGHPSVMRPDFFIVGAFKAGTTALYEYLRAHPDIFMSVPKEPMYFGQDLTPRYRRMSQDEYLALFKDARPDQHAGEASPWYLYSKSAPAEIRDFNNEAKAIIMLRNPVDVMYSQHSQLVFNQREDLTDFEQALAAEDDRLAGHRIPADAIRPEALYYRRSVRFVEQIERYRDVLGRDRLHYVVFDDLVADPRAVYRDTLEFVGVDPAFEVDLSVYNPNKKPRSGAMQKMIFAPRGPMKQVFGRLRSVPAMHRVRDVLVSANSTKAERQRLDPELRRRLTDEFAPQVAELGALIGRDLSTWSK